MVTTENTLKNRWEDLKATEPNLRIRNAAQKLNVSEVELLATQCGEEVIRLKPEFANILGKVEELGKVMALTRNEYMVHERKGTYLNPSLDNAHVGLFVGEDIDLRIFFKNWDSAFAVSQETKAGNRYSLQFFAKNGEAVHKIFLIPQSNYEAFEALVEEFKHEDQSAYQQVKELPAEDPQLPDAEIDVEKFQKGWIELKDTHHFFGLVRKHKLKRMQALRLAPEGNYAVKVEISALRKALEIASEKGTSIMIFVGNGNMIQIHTGKVKNIVDARGWLNVLDPEFNLHANEAGIAHAWVVRKPTEDGTVTALEFYDNEGQQIIQLFGARKPGIPELTEWREIVDTVETACKL